MLITIVLHVVTGGNHLQTKNNVGFHRESQNPCVSIICKGTMNISSLYAATVVKPFADKSVSLQSGHVRLYK